MDNDANQSQTEQRQNQRPQAGTGGPAPVSIEEAGSQAFSEALKSSFTIVKVVMVILVIVFFASGIFTVPSGGSAIVLRFGKPVGGANGRLLGPGLHWAFPYPVDEIVPIPGGQLHTVRSTAGWYATSPEMEASKSEPEPGLSLNPATDGFTLTADGNIIHVRSQLRYRIDNPIRYIFGFSNGTNDSHFAGASNLVQNALNNALFHTSARYTVDQALADRTGFKERVLARVNDLVTEQNLGIKVESADLDLIAPRQVKPKFDEVTTASQEADNARSTAQGYANEIVSRAQGEAAALVNAGVVASNQVVQAVQAETKYLTDQLPYFQRDPQLYFKRLQIEALQRILTNVNVHDKWVMLDGPEGKPREIRLQLNRGPQKLKPKQAAKSDEAPITRDTRRR
jgi:membrane protease subunit HflK